MFALHIFDAFPEIRPYTTEAEAVAAGRLWAKAAKGDPRWSVGPLMMSTLIWGDTASEPGVFHFTPCLPGASTDDVRRAYYESVSWIDSAEGVEEAMAETWTLVAHLPGIISEMV